MRRLSGLLLFLLFTLPVLSGAWEVKQAEDKDGFAYEYIPGDPSPPAPTRLRTA